MFEVVHYNIDLYFAVFCSRAKLYRYETAAKEWKERGVGEMKILHHPVNKTYRLLLRREQVIVPYLLECYLYFFFLVFVFCFDGVFIAAQCTATFLDLLCSPEFRYY